MSLIGRARIIAVDMTKDEFTLGCVAAVKNDSNYAVRAAKLQIWFQNNLNNWMREISDSSFVDYDEDHIGSQFVRFITNKPNIDNDIYFIIKYNFSDLIITLLPEVRDRINGTSSL